MHEAFAEKLRLWLVSMMTLILGTVSASIIILLGPLCTTSNGRRCINASGELLMVFSVLFFIIVAWHAFDFIQNCKPRRWLASLLAGYPVIFGALSLLLLLFALHATGRFTTIAPCGGIFVILSQACFFVEPWLWHSEIGLLLLLPLLTLAKGVFVAHSRLLKRS
jgi:hypothetical protein